MSDYLFASPSFVSGVARSFDLFGTFDGYNESPTGAIADAIALRNDWRAVGEDVLAAARRPLPEATSSPND